MKKQEEEIQKSFETHCKGTKKSILMTIEDFSGVKEIVLEILMTCGKTCKEYKNNN